MILANHGIVSSSGSSLSFDADALAFITLASITDNTQKTAVNTLVTDLKTYNIWAKMKAIYPFVGGTATSHACNLKDPRDLDDAYRLVFYGGWTHSSTGALPNGTNAYAETWLNPFSRLTNNNYHLSHYSRTQQTNNNAVDIGVESGNNPYPQISLSHYYSSLSIKFAVLGIYPTTTITINNTNTQGLLIGNRMSQTDGKMYFNGSQIGSTLTVSNTSTLPNNTIYLGSNHGTLGNATSFSSKEQAFASIGDGLTDTEASNLYTAVQSFNTTLSRNL